MPDFINPIIDPGSELADVLDAILRDLSQVVDYDHVRILLLPSVLDVRRTPAESTEDNHLITVRDLGSLSALLSPLDPIALDRYPLNRLRMTMQKPIPARRARRVTGRLPAPRRAPSAASEMPAVMSVRNQPERVNPTASEPVTSAASRNEEGMA